MRVCVCQERELANLMFVLAYSGCDVFVINYSQVPKSL